MKGDSFQRWFKSTTHASTCKTVAKIIIIIVTPVLKHYKKTGTHSTDFLTWELTVLLLLVFRHFFGIWALGVVLYPITIIIVYYIHCFHVYSMEPSELWFNKVTAFLCSAICVLMVFLFGSRTKNCSLQLILCNRISLGACLILCLKRHNVIWEQQQPLIAAIFETCEGGYKH